MSKTYTYTILIAVLLLLNLWIFFDNSSTISDESVTYFGHVDLEEVRSLKFDLESNDVELRRESDGWMLNESFRADQGFMNSLLSILKRVEIGRTIDDWNQSVVGEVVIEIIDQEQIRLQLATNATGTKTYFVNEGVASEVAVPGYRDNVIDLFTLHPDQWRDRVVFDGNWRTIQQVHVSFAGSEPSFNVRFDDKFFLINGESPSDSTAVINYLNQFEYFQANEMISSGRFTNFDSLSQTEPFATVTIDDIKGEKPVGFDVFPALNGQGFHLLMKNQSELMVLDAGRVARMLQKP